jgi:hypothetical protein
MGFKTKNNIKKQVTIITCKEFKMVLVESTGNTIVYIIYVYEDELFLLIFSFLFCLFLIVGYNM